MLIRLNVFILVLHSFLYAGTQNASSVSLTDVTTAYNACSDGDTVYIPAGSSTWSSGLTLDSSKTVSFIGAGIAGDDSTVITDGTSATFGDVPFWVEIGANDWFVISGIIFKGTSDAVGIIRISGTSKLWRITDCKFLSLSYRCISVSGYTYGLIDNCIFTGNFSSAINIHGDLSYAWARDLSLGTANAVYVEDCSFNLTASGDGALDANGGARFVFRYNTIIATANNEMGCHGQDSGVDRSAFSWEIYNNSYNGNSTFRAIHLRGGTGVVYDNTLIGYSVGLHISSYRSCEGEGWDNPTYGRCDGNNLRDGNTPLDSGLHDGITNSSGCKIIDKSWNNDEWIEAYIWNVTDGSRGIITGNTSDSVAVTLSGGTDNDFDIGDSIKITNGYPCQDQIGRSTDTTPENYTSNTDQILEPAYEWGNTLDGGDLDFIVNTSGLPCDNPSQADHVQEGRDYYNDMQRPDYETYTYPHPLTGGSSPEVLSEKKTDVINVEAVGN